MMVMGRVPAAAALLSIYYCVVAPCCWQQRAAAAAAASSSSSSSTAAARAGGGSARSGTENYYYDDNNGDNDDDNDNDNDDDDDNMVNTNDQDDEQQHLVHVPMINRAAVLRERGLHRLLEEEAEEDASATFARWARGGGRGGTTAGDGDGDGDARRGNNRHLRPRGGEDADDAVGADATTTTTTTTTPTTTRRNRALQELSGEGTHFIEAYVGSPAQRRTLAVSSGSDFTAFPCEGCTRCGPIISSYAQSLSSSFLSMPCGRCVGGQRDDVCDADRERCIARGYNLVDKSAWTAYEARDYVYVGGAEDELEKMGLDKPLGTNFPEEHGFPLVFACQTEATGWYASQVQDGVVGFSTARTSMVNQMVFQDMLKHPRFTMCFEQKILMGEDNRSAGVVTLGGYNPHVLDFPLVYAQNTETGGTRYKVRVRNIYFRKEGGQSIVPDNDKQAVVRLQLDEVKFNEKNGGTILDSGVPLIIFDKSIQQSFLDEWKRMVGTDFTFGRMLITENDVKALPTLIIQVMAHEAVDKSFDPRTVPNMAGDRDPRNPFDGLIAIPATHYLEYNPSTGTYRAKIVLDSEMGSFLGINAMQGHAFFHDLAKDRIGFAESYNCQPKAGIAGLVDDDMFELPTVQHEPLGGIDPNGPLGSGPIDGGMPGGIPGGGPGVTSRGPVPDGMGSMHYDTGRCVTATCISFVTVGYCMVITALAVAYKKYRPRDRSKQFDETREDDNNVADDETEVLNPVFEQHRVRNSVASLGDSIRGMLA